MSSYKLEAPQSIYEKTSLQDGGVAQGERLTEEEQLDVFGRPERRLSVGTYRQIPRKFLRFIWQGVTYKFKCLPFGLSSAPRTFTKLLQPVMAVLRSQGMRRVIYLDDMLMLAENKEELVL